MLLRVASLTIDILVLACQGPELKGYLRKQANSKAVRKHMHNGGSNSFNFHCSPRMVNAKQGMPSSFLN